MSNKNNILYSLYCNAFQFILIFAGFLYLPVVESSDYLTAHILVAHCQVLQLPPQSGVKQLITIYEIATVVVLIAGITGTVSHPPTFYLLLPLLNNRLLPGKNVNKVNVVVVALLSSSIKSYFISESAGFKQKVRN